MRYCDTSHFGHWSIYQLLQKAHLSHAPWLSFNIEYWYALEIWVTNLKCH